MSLPSRSTYPLLLLGLLSLWSCSANQQAQTWLRQTERQWHRLQQQQPSWPEMLDSSAWQAQRQFVQQSIAAADQWLEEALDPALVKRLQEVRTRLQQAQNDLNQQARDASGYNFGRRLEATFPGDQVLDAAAVKALSEQLTQAEVYYQVARQKLLHPEPARCDSAVRQHIRAIYFLQEVLPTRLSQPIPILNQRLDAASVALKDYLAWCRSCSVEARH